MRLFILMARETRKFRLVGLSLKNNSSFKGSDKAFMKTPCKAESFQLDSIYGQVRHTLCSLLQMAKVSQLEPKPSGKETPMQTRGNKGKTSIKQEMLVVETSRYGRILQRDEDD